MNKYQYASELQKPNELTYFPSKKFVQCAFVRPECTSRQSVSHSLRLIDQICINANDYLSKWIMWHECISKCNVVNAKSLWNKRKKLVSSGILECQLRDCVVLFLSFFSVCVCCSWRTRLFTRQKTMTTKLRMDNKRQEWRKFHFIIKDKIGRARRNRVK